MTFAMGCAAALYRDRLHPRLMCGPDELAALRRRVRGGWGRKLYTEVRRRALLAAKALDADPRRGVPADVNSLALIAALDRDAKMVASLRQTLAALPALGDKGTEDRLSTAYNLGAALAFTYDLMAPHMSIAEREPVVQWFAAASVRAVLSTIRSKNYLRHAGMNIPMAGLISVLQALMAIDGDPGAPDLSAERKEALLFLEAALFSSLGPQGYPVEDIGYGTLMTNMIAWPVEAARRAGWYDAYTQCPRYAAFGNAMLHFMQPWGKVTSNTGDYGADFGLRSMVLPRLASELRDPSILWMHGTLTVPWAAAGPNPVKAYRRTHPEVTLALDFRVPADAGSLLTLADLRSPKGPEYPSRRRARPTAFMDSDRGIVSFRSSWKSDATFVIFDGSQRPAGAQGHAHDSGGSFTLSALGEYFAMDTGRYNIEQEHHNVIVVDGKSGHVNDGTWVAAPYQARLTGYHPGPFVDSASVDSSQMSNCYWARRTLMLVKGGDAPAYVWTAEDVNHANDYRQFHWLINAHPDGRIALHEKHATLHGAYHGNMLDVHFALPSPRVFPKPHTLELTQREALGGSPKEYLRDGETHREIDARYRRGVGNPEWGPSFVRPRLHTVVSGYNGRFLSLMIPRRKGEKPATIEQLPTPDNTLAVRITFGKVIDTLVWAYETNLLEADDISARGQWCVVRRSRATGKIVNHAIHEGVSFRVGGKALM